VLAAKSIRTVTISSHSVRSSPTCYISQNLNSVSAETTEYANGAHCGKTISITDSNTGKTATGVVADECPGCGAKNNIDLSQGLFEVFAPDSTGTFPSM